MGSSYRVGYCVVRVSTDWETPQTIYFDTTYSSRNTWTGNFFRNWDTSGGSTSSLN